MNLFSLDANNMRRIVYSGRFDFVSVVFFFVRFVFVAVIVVVIIMLYFGLS